MPRRWRGVLCIEGVQTGDGRVIADGAISWAELPLPLGWLQEEQHGDLLSGAVQVGTIDSVERQADGVIFGSGVIDDEQPDGAELVRRMDAGTAAMGNRIGVSIDPDDYELQVVAPEDSGADDVLILASGGVLPAPSVAAAAGEPDVADGDGVVLFEDSVDSVLFRFTRLRMRGATCCAIPAFDGAYIELEPMTAEDAAADGGQVTDHAFVDENNDGECDYCVEEADDGSCAQMCGQPADAHAEASSEARGTTVASVASAAPAAPPRSWFASEEPPLDDPLWIEQPDGNVAVPVQITDDGQVFGHLGRWSQCHTGYPGACVSPPESMRAYADFMVGETRCDDGTSIATGVLTVGCDHAAAHLMSREARDHYANTGLAWADVRVHNGEVGPWVSGALRPGLSDDVVRALRSSSLSGDWRRIGGALELIAVLSVNAPGFPIVREALAAGAAPQPLTAATVGMDDDGAQLSLVAAGVVQRCADCARREREARSLRVGVELADESLRIMRLVSSQLSVLERRTRHLVPAAMQAQLQRLRASATD